MLTIPSIVVCGLYYYVWAILLPKWKGYSLRQELVTLDGGAQTHLLRKVPNADVAAWDASHDAAGQMVRSDATEEKDAIDDGSLDDGKRAYVSVTDDGRA